ncbi:hypothetical protein THAOC_23763 [Thalassiosira oceanica]|uniref:Uncharacterized protein n=1 Tax=Thalassiosira oceanica TaxID=159749 RepID=K0RV81_THAOC|nr:hypothetical protein THAOC_23763 [Thalassiosira oceanica]|eukprot:EJK56364.1 hypothetical protein THAOC_23763 [Thalassiosira oceanica]
MPQVAPSRRRSERQSEKGESAESGEGETVPASVLPEEERRSEERRSEERGSSSSDGSSRGLSPEGSSLKRAAINGEAAGDRRMAARRRKGHAAAMGAAPNVIEQPELSSGGGSLKRAQYLLGVAGPQSYRGPVKGESQEAQNRSIPANKLSIIKEAMKKTWGIDEPRLFQVRAIYEGSFNDGSAIRVWA